MVRGGDVQYRFGVVVLQVRRIVAAQMGGGLFSHRRVETAS